MGETLGLVSESSCGKEHAPAASSWHPFERSTIRIDGQPVMEDGRKTATAVQTVFQDPFASLDPRMKVRRRRRQGRSPTASCHCRRPAPGPCRAYWFRAGRPRSVVGQPLSHNSPAASQLYPPSPVGDGTEECSSATSGRLAHDVSIQAQVINLFLELRRRLNLPRSSSATISVVATSATASP